MMKKVFAASVCVALCSAFCFSACTDPNEGKTLTKEDYAKALSTVSASFEGMLEKDDAAKSLAYTSIAAGDLVEVEENSQEFNISVTCIAVVYFFENLCNSEEYTIKKTAEDCALNDAAHDFVGKARILLDYDMEKKALIAEMYAVPDGASGFSTYFSFEICYDFDTETLSSYTLAGNIDTARYFEHDGTAFKILPLTAPSYDAFKTEIASMQAQFSAAEWATDLPDYTEEYVAGLSKAYGLL